MTAICSPTRCMAAATIPAFYIEAVAVAPRGAWPLKFGDLYAEDTAHIAEYLRMRRDARRVSAAISTRTSCVAAPHEPPVTATEDTLGRGADRRRAAAHRAARGRSPSAPIRRSPRRRRSWRSISRPSAPNVSLQQSPEHNFWTDGGRELFDCAGQGRIDAFFFSGGADRRPGNINLVVIGDYAQPKARFAGSFGSAYLYFVVPRVILFRLEHSRRTLVEGRFRHRARHQPAQRLPPRRADRLGDAAAVTCFRQGAGRASASKACIPATRVEEVLDNTGFAFDRPATRAGDAGAFGRATLSLLREHRRAEARRRSIPIRRRGLRHRSAPEQDNEAID